MCLLLVTHFVKEFNTHEKRSVEVLPEAMIALIAYEWPRSVSELENVIRRSATLCDNDIVSLGGLPLKVQAVVPLKASSDLSYQGHSLKIYLREREKEYIQRVLEVAGGDKEKAADMLGFSLATFYRKCDW